MQGTSSSYHCSLPGALPCSCSERAKALLNLPFPAPVLHVPRNCHAQTQQEHQVDPGSNSTPHKAVSGSKDVSRDRAASQKAQDTSHQHVNETRLCSARPCDLPKQLLKLSSSIHVEQILKDLSAYIAEARGRAASQLLQKVNAPDAPLSLPGPQGLKLNPAAPVFTGQPQAEGLVQSPTCSPPIYQRFSAGKTRT